MTTIMTYRPILILLCLLLALPTRAVPEDPGQARDTEPVTRTLVWPDGTRYVGGVLNGQRSGKGTIFWQDGTRFVGQFKNDLRNGPGTMILPDGTVFTGFFKDDLLVDTRDTLAASRDGLSAQEREPVAQTPPAAATGGPDITTAMPGEPPQQVRPPQQVMQKPRPEPASVEPAAAMPKPTPAGPVTRVTAAIEEELVSAIECWKNAWSGQDVDGYLASYSSDFNTPRGEPRATWERVRRARLTRPAYIRIDVTYERFELIEPDVVEVQFRQGFESNTYADESDKILRMRREHGTWKILEERSINIER